MAPCFLLFASPFQVKLSETTALAAFAVSELSAYLGNFEF